MRSFSPRSPLLGLTTLLLSLSFLTTALSLTNTNAQQLTEAPPLTAPLTGPLSPQDVVETVAIQQVLNAFSVALDQRRFDLFDHIFTPDVTVNLNLRGFPILRNLNDVAAYIGKLLQGYRTFHAQSSHFIRLAEDKGHAYATTYNTATYLADRQAPAVKLGRWEDTLVKTPSGWLISKRILIHVGAGNSVLGVSGDNNSTDTLF